MSDAIDRLLLETLAHGRFVSGEQLAQDCGVSRTAIWKRLQRFTEQWGLDIHAVTGKGYRLSAPLELLNVDRIVADGASAAPVEIHLTLPSTNSHLLEQLASKTVLNGTACFAEHQSAGRGRRGREWISPFARNLYLSVYWRFDCSMAELGALSLVVGTLICRLMHDYEAEGVGLKWPNDVLVDGRKLAGILVDIHGSAEGPVEAVIGIGFNVSMPTVNGDAIDQPWIDLHMLDHGKVERNQLAADLLRTLREGLATYATLGFHVFANEWRQYDAYHGSEVTLTMGDREIGGKHAGIAEDGGLLLETVDGIRRYYSGEVSLRGKADV